jgi:hypothetical protein
MLHLANLLKTSPVVLLAGFLLQGCAALYGPADEERVFEGMAGIQWLTPVLQQSSMLADCPPPTIHTFDFAFRQFPGRAMLGRESFKLNARQQGISELLMSGEGERRSDLRGVENWSITRGRQVSCGGLLTLAFSETRAIEEAVPECATPTSIITGRQPLPNHRYGMTQISQPSGELFPLRVGGEHSFAYTALFRGWSPESGCTDLRFEQRVHFRVLSANDAFAIGDLTVPGRVYLIERSLLDMDGNLQEKRDYYFSDALGWVVMEVDYDDGIPGSIRSMIDWQ